MRQPERMAVLSGVRTPFCRSWGALSEVSAVDLGVSAVTAAVSRSGLTERDIEEVVIGNVAGPADASNIARVIALKSGIPHDRIAHTVNRNCGSGMEAIVTAQQILAAGRARFVVAGGTESMSRIPMLVPQETAGILMEAGKAKTFPRRVRALARLRPRHFRPVPAVSLGLTDPVCGLNMGQTAEVLAAEFGVTRAEQDEFALESHRRAVAAREGCFLSGEIAPVQAGSTTLPTQDNCPRENQTLEQLSKLRPMFRADGTVTAGNSCPLTDGAAAVVLTRERDAVLGGDRPLGFVSATAIAGCDPRRMGLGPVYAIARLFRETGLRMSDFDLIEINEAFAAQVLACLRAMESGVFADREPGLPSAPGKIDRDQLNVHGGAIALGHPVGASGTRIVITLLRALRQRGLQRGLAALCIGGGQGMAMVVEQPS